MLLSAGDSFAGAAALFSVRPFSLLRCGEKASMNILHRYIAKTVIVSDRSCCAGDDCPGFRD